MTAGAAWSSNAALAAGVWGAGKLLRRPGRRVQRAKKAWLRGLDEDDDRKKEAEKPDSVLFGNMTEWGPQAKRYILSEHGLGAEGQWNAVGFAEHHLASQDLHKLRAAMGIAGFRTCALAAERSGRSASGTHGGVCVSVGKRFAATVVGPDAKHQDGSKLWGDGWATVVLHRAGLDVAYTCAYFECAGGKLTPTITRKAKEIRTCHGELGIPWILAADFNATPEEIKKSGLLAILGGQVMVPEGVEFTCTAGHKQMLD